LISPYAKPDRHFAFQPFDKGGIKMDFMGKELGLDAEPLVMSPLADPVISAIFSNKESAGEAAASLIKAILEEDGEDITIGEILSVTPQRHYNQLNQRGCRVDVEIVTVNNERIIVEVQLYRASGIFHRNLFSAAHVYSASSMSGSSSDELARSMPRVIVINILDQIIRSDNNDVIQPVKIVYTKPPQRMAISNLMVYTVQLPRIDEMEPDFGKAWYCWFYALYHADKEKKTLREVIDMSQEIKDFVERDSGFKQFCELFGRVAGDPGTYDEYMHWIVTRMREQGMRQAAHEDGFEEGRAEGREAGRAEVAMNMLHAGMSPETISKLTGLSLTQIGELDNP